MGTQDQKEDDVIPRLTGGSGVTMHFEDYVFLSSIIINGNKKKSLEEL